MKILKDCFSKELNFIFASLEKIEVANSLVIKNLPLEFQEYCKVVNLRQNVLVIEVSDGVWASQLRYQLPTLLTVLRKEEMFCGLVKIEITIKK